ncbi:MULTISPECIES: DUF523 and DUF1722 domain-containing protein [Idiomarina]|uniref:DUF1722 domain-containing protein n=1 Tax=Idiomarina abyssalis TaxID=86102 RepID=A0A8I1KHD6_9GAMM|nr:MULTISPECIES: DUF523 and DUF1722 domain-containing protein [Idiomarina]MAB22285.1 hypothetical protein [Idiomarina sp.]MAO67319.1 hypothetical protein [Idiomarina sp.]MBE93425.1 hypothetical protein [Idiomarina sp.]MBF80117.1 hypothetical protein [Idiomarina sp.]MBH95206.1 hypothetical protein [Idiomarina sp.]
MVKLKVGISSCLMGDEVRFDGGHKKSSFCVDELSRHIQLVRFCPEVGIGMPVPRPTIRLEQHDTVQAVVPKTGQNVTKDLATFADKVQVKVDELSGYILCAKSPSCGMERVKLYDPETGHAQKAGMGIFAARLKENNPALPLEEDGRLNDPHLRENFVMRVYVFNQWKEVRNNLSKHRLLQFHQSCKLLLLAHNQQAYRELGKRLGEQDVIDDVFAQQYIVDVMDALAKPASRKNHTNVLQHIQGYFKSDLEQRRREELSDIILQYHDGILPLMSPLTLIRHYLREFPKEYLEGQWYLKPYPEDLKLRYGL